MTPDRYRAAASLIVRLALHIMPAGQREWARAMLHEVEAIEAGPAAVLFALGCVRGALVAAARDRAARCVHGLTSFFQHPGDPDMDASPAPRTRDLIVGILCAVGAVGLGLVHMAMGGASVRLIVVNIAAVGVGLGLCLLLVQSRALRDGRINVIAPVLGAALLAVALFGARADGAARWVDVAGLVVQPTLLFIPMMLMLHARRGDGWTVAGLALAIAATAAQPDRAMAGVLVGALAVVALKGRERRDVWLAAVAAVGFVVTVVRPDNGGVSPFVDQIFYSAFQVHPLAGLGLALGAVLLIAPGAVQATRGQDPAMGLAFGATWSLVVLAALMGNYPTPLVGYGGSAIIGYLLSLAVLGPVRLAAVGRAKSASIPKAESDAGDRRVAVSA